MNFIIRILVAMYCFSSCVSSISKLEKDYDLKIYQNKNEDLSSCTFVRKFHDDAAWGGYREAIAKIAERAQDYKVDTLKINDTSWWTGSADVGGYSCGAKG